jgi:hypothetical protein
MRKMAPANTHGTEEENHNDRQITQREQGIEKGKKGNPYHGNDEKQWGNSPLSDYINHPAFMKQILLHLEGIILESSLQRTSRLK